MLAQLEALYGPAGRAAQNSGPIVLGFARRARRSSLALAIRTLVLTGLAIFALWATPQGDAIRGSMVTAVPFLFGQPSEDVILDSLRPKCIETRAQLVNAAVETEASSWRTRRDLLLKLDGKLSSETRGAWPVVCRALLASFDP